MDLHTVTIKMTSLEPVDGSGRTHRGEDLTVRWSGSVSLSSFKESEPERSSGKFPDDANQQILFIGDPVAKLKMSCFISVEFQIT